MMIGHWKLLHVMTPTPEGVKQVPTWINLERMLMMQDQGEMGTNLCVDLHVGSDPKNPGESLTIMDGFWVKETPAEIFVAPGLASPAMRSAGYATGVPVQRSSE